MDRYRIYLHLDLLETLPKTIRAKTQNPKLYRSLEQNPFTKGDFTDKDSSVRTREIKIIGDHAITFWADHPVKSVMVVDIQPAD
jgi:hypothetical protein